MKWKLGEYRDLRNLIEVTILGEPYYLPYIPIMVTYFKLLKSNPDDRRVLGFGVQGLVSMCYYLVNCAVLSSYTVVHEMVAPQTLNPKP